ncbi:deoxyribonuclease IV [Anaeromyxobacter paludicola]|uniref:Probable endonuclease 4 n=1 Tax=Anaeromyxobacter paludicola TaxID=2918171 RepID=A0ABM7X935_9BACT|nr:deoxyribonuclease IV [Anaeromyxobacter paludicola]BDG08366.1 putative endonuclease 4 [Anaeromyxobacter paludicola]
MILGAHEGIAGGVSTAFARAEADGADCLQIFTRNARGWAAKPLDPEEVARFRAEAARTGKPTAAHCTYLVNLCSGDAEIRRKSWDGLADELGRCEALGVPSLVFHPGSCEDEPLGLRLVAEGMTEALERSPGRSRLLLETTAGQGASLGWRFEHLAAIREAVPAKLRRRVGVCVDTCHLHAAGYDLLTEEGYEATFAELDRTLGLGLVQAFHLNDSKKGRGCRVDRHEHIGDGALGTEPFRRLVNDPRFADVPAFLETELRFKENLEVLRSLLR